LPCYQPPEHHFYVLAIAVLAWIISAGLGWLIGQSKNRALDGFLLGLFLGVLGLVIVVFMKPSSAFQLTPSGWQRDPSGRHELRFGDGACWTEHVSDRGVASIDPPTLLTPAEPAGWLHDPSGRHQLRYWNGERWTEHVSDAGTVSTLDPPTL